MPTQEKGLLPALLILIGQLLLKLVEVCRYTYLFFRVLPAALFVSGLIYEARRLRTIRQMNGKVRLTEPAFVWLKKIWKGR
ncbi:MAG: hypothetical protein U9Q82_05485 [Chloroflexota bacterium]|nr:hypothetical protein [Chloroflexota bacterium]